MSAAKSRPAAQKPKPKAQPKAKAKPGPKSASAGAKARSAATGVAKSAAKGAAKGAARSAARGAVKASSKAAAAGGEQIGRGTRWTEAQVRLLMETVGASATAKEAFETVARELDKSAGTVAQKYYNLQKAAGGSTGTARRGRPAGSKATTRGVAGRVPTATDLRGLSVDDLVSLTALVRDEVERRREELDAASKLLPH
jgi:hypothetical protein